MLKVSSSGPRKSDYRRFLVYHSPTETSEYFSQPPTVLCRLLCRILLYMLKINTKAPTFSLPDQNGREYSLAYHPTNATKTTPPPRFILVYFYPKDDTPGCTKEACAIAEAYEDFERNRVRVLGISADLPESHKKFAEKYNLPFTLLSDPTKATIMAYGALKNSSGESGAFNGGTARVSYLIAAEGPEAGTIVKVYPNVDPATHAGEILKDVAKLIC